MLGDGLLYIEVCGHVADIQRDIGLLEESRCLEQARDHAAAHRLTAMRKLEGNMGSPCYAQFTHSTTLGLPLALRTAIAYQAALTGCLIE
ncbi:MAG: hypothetical protein NZM11_06355, partial [Anaerolineales bacterium]|nr:hypothetical protein [Anaerolineales bacterium]